MRIDLRDLRHGLGLRPLTSSYFSWNSCSQRWRCDSIESINQRQLIATRARVESYTLTRCYHHLLGANDFPRSSAILFYPARAPNRGLRHFPAVGFSNDETSHCLKSHDWLHATSAAGQAPGLSCGVFFKTGTELAIRLFGESLFSSHQQVILQVHNCCKWLSYVWCGVFPDCVFGYHGRANLGTRRKILRLSSYWHLTGFAASYSCTKLHCDSTSASI